jgi:hypothetical protein
MKEKQDYIKDVAEIRSMMERATKFLSLSGWSGIMAGIYALIGVYLAYTVFNFNPDKIDYKLADTSLVKVIIIALLVLLMALVTAIYFSFKKSNRRGEKIWNSTSRRLVISMAIPLVSGGVLVIVFILKGLIGLIAPLTLIFYGLALYNASKFTIDEVKHLGIIQIGLGLLSSYLIEYGLIIWTIGFGVMHILYGTYMYYRYER